MIRTLAPALVTVAVLVVRPAFADSLVTIEMPIAGSVSRPPASVVITDGTREGLQRLLDDPRETTPGHYGGDTEILEDEQFSGTMTVTFRDDGSGAEVHCSAPLSYEATAVVPGRAIRAGKGECTEPAFEPMPTGEHPPEAAPPSPDPGPSSPATPPQN